jgi:class 3 adenylate cyclase
MLVDNIRNFDAYLASNSDDAESVIHDLWLSKEQDLWSTEPHFYIRLAETADRLGQVMFAHDVVSEGLSHFPSNLRLLQLSALLLVKCGFPGKARDILSALVKDGSFDEETLGILGRVYKEIWVLSGGPSGERGFLEKSRSFYLQAFKTSGGTYSGINAASLTFMCGETDRAQKLARRVLAICAKNLKDPRARDYWTVATVGEAFILLGRFDRVAKYLTLARKLAGREYSYLASTRKQLLLLGRYADIPDEVLDLLSVPPVIAFTGHMIDRPGRKAPRFPPELVAHVKSEIANRIALLGASIGYSSAACGSDVLFLECMQDRRAETNVIFPFEREDFFRTSVAHGGDLWVERTEAVLHNAATTTYATEGTYLGDDLLFDYANRIIMGKAILRSRILETDPVLLTVWDGKDDDKPGGTAVFRKTWSSMGFREEIINLDNIRRHVTIPRSVGRGGRTNGRRRSAAGGRNRAVRRDVKAVLFADLAGFSTIREEQVPSFMENFLGGIAGHLKQSPHKPVFRNIWGDALFFVFDDVTAAAEYALGLRDFVRGLDWKSMNLPDTLSIRIGLHAGPVFWGREPVLGRTNYFGTHVNRAARIEPITNPGNVYASEQFAALLMSGSSNGLDCRYVGVIVLPKKFGKYPIYHVKRKNELE